MRIRFSFAKKKALSFLYKQKYISIPPSVHIYLLFLSFFHVTGGFLFNHSHIPCVYTIFRRIYVYTVENGLCIIGKIACAVTRPKLKQSIKRIFLLAARYVLRIYVRCWNIYDISSYVFKLQFFASVVRFLFHNRCHLVSNHFCFVSIFFLAF